LFFFALLFVLLIICFYKKVFKSKKPSLGPIRGSGLPTSTSTLITSAADLRPSVPASSCDSDASAQVTADFSVSVQLRPRHLRYLLIVIGQTAHNLGVSTSVSALEISDPPLVSVRRQFSTPYH
jgi:hypothetical protein